MNIKRAIEILERQIPNPSENLPEEIFLFISRLTPLVNVDLLIKDENNRTLLSWRNDIYAGTGWHIPGGILRFKESFESRIIKVAQKEIGVTVAFDPVPISINPIICKNNTRGHFISFLYKCSLYKTFIPKNIGLKKNNVGYLQWHDCCPQKLIKIHEIYRKYINSI